MQNTQFLLRQLWILTTLTGTWLILLSNSNILERTAPATEGRTRVINLQGAQVAKWYGQIFIPREKIQVEYGPRINNTQFADGLGILLLPTCPWSATDQLHRQCRR